MIQFDKVNKWFGAYQALVDVNERVQKVKSWWSAARPARVNRP